MFLSWYFIENEIFNIFSLPVPKQKFKCNAIVIQRVYGEEEESLLAVKKVELL